MLLEITLLLVGLVLGIIVTAVFYKSENNELHKKVLDLETKCSLLCDYIDEKESKG